MGPASEVGPDQIARLKEVLGWVRDYVKKGFAAGTKDFTVADICFVATYATILASEAFDLSSVNQELNDWLEKCKAAIPNYEKANGEGATSFGDWYKSQVAAKKSA